MIPQRFIRSFPNPYQKTMADGGKPEPQIAPSPAVQDPQRKVSDVVDFGSSTLDSQETLKEEAMGDLSPIQRGTNCSLLTL